MVVDRLDPAANAAQLVRPPNLGGKLAHIPTVLAFLRPGRTNCGSSQGGADGAQFRRLSGRHDPNLPVQQGAALDRAAGDQATRGRARRAGGSQSGLAGARHCDRERQYARFQPVSYAERAQRLRAAPAGLVRHRFLALEQWHGPAGLRPAAAKRHRRRQDVRPAKRQGIRLRS